MADTVEFELVAPERLLVSTQVEMVVVPGAEGDFGVLPNHSALMSAIRPGVIKVFSEGSDEPQLIFVAGGFADVTETNCTVLAEEAANVNDLNKADIEQTIRNLSEDLNLVEGEADKVRVQQKLEIAKAKLTAVTGGIVL